MRNWRIENWFSLASRWCFIARSIGFGPPLVDKPYQMQVMKARSSSRCSSRRVAIPPRIRARVYTRAQRERVINPTGPRQRSPIVINRSLTVSSSLTGYWDRIDRFALEETGWRTRARRERVETRRLMGLIIARLASDESLFVPAGLSAERRAFIFSLPIINSSRRWAWLIARS